jgi:feruloyl esterase
MNRTCCASVAAIAGCLWLDSAPAQAPIVGPSAPGDEPACLAVAALELPELVALDAAWLPANATRPAHCRVTGVVDLAIRFEVWMPASQAWNGRFLGIGGGGFAGVIDRDRLATALADGYAAAATDTGHEAGDFGWLADSARLRDFGFRAIYEMTAKSAAIVPAFYARPADYRYFNGCSLGGRQGLMEAQRFPADYDGIVAGAPVNAFIDTRTTQLWATRAAAPEQGAPGLLGPDVLAMVGDAAIAQCDSLDGVLDGVLEDPRRCSFDPANLQCGVSSGSRCLSAGQVSALRDIYAGPAAFVPGEDGAEPFSLALPGFAFGSEAGMGFAAGEGPSELTLEFFRRAVFRSAFWNWRDLELAADYPQAMATVGWMLDATASDLSAFRDNGGKLLLYHGWSDSNNSPEATIEWYESVEASLARAPNPRSIATDAFARLFMVPGMAHCRGGTGTDRFDAQRAIEDWVERGIAPDRIEAARVENGETVRTRPLCPYPLVARYQGSGDTDRTGSFRCAN